MRKAAGAVRAAFIAFARVLVILLLCVAVSKLLSEGLEFAAPYIATTIAIDAQIRLAILEEESDGRDE